MEKKTIRFDRHARRRMKWRKISEEDILRVLDAPDKVKKSVKGRMNAYRVIGQRHIKVSFKEFTEEILVISVVDKA